MFTQSWIVGLTGMLCGFVLQTQVWAQGESAKEDARKHYRVGEVALQHNDLDTAVKEFQKTVELAPDNALAWYNLAVVQSKQEGDPQGALRNLQRALELGLPEKEKEAANTLEAKLTYQAKKFVPILYFAGSWARIADEQNTIVCTTKQISQKEAELRCSPGNPFGGIRRYYRFTREKGNTFRVLGGSSIKGYDKDARDEVWGRIQWNPDDYYLFTVDSPNSREFELRRKAGGYIERFQRNTYPGWLGASLQTVTSDLAHSLGLNKPQGVLITELDENGPAERAGLKRGDVIIAFEGTKIKNSHQLSSTIALWGTGEQAEVSILRNGKKWRYSVRLGARSFSE